MIQKIKRIPNFFRETVEELKKVNWSSRHELTSAAVVVVIVSTVLTLYIFGIDVALTNAVQVVLR